MLEYKETISAEDYLALRDSATWTKLPKDEAQSGLDNSAYIIACYDGSRAVGCARIVWDRGYIAYLSDVLVLPHYRKQGIGRTLVEYAIAFVKAQLKPNWKIKIVLVAAKGKETFYGHFGFIERPTENDGAGMELWVNSK